MPMAGSAVCALTFRFTRTGADPPAVGSSSGIIMNMSSSRRYLSVWLRRLPTDRIERRSSKPVETFVVVASVQSAQRIIALTDGAARLGLKAGMGLADARAMYPKLPVVEADPEADRRLLEGIADWCDRYTPLVGIDPPDGLLLDVTGCAHLFGGEAALARDLIVRLAQQGLRARVAVADTAGCAWGVARYGEQGIVPAGETRAAMLDLPIAALRVDAETVADLKTSGLTCVADLMSRPRAPFAARFGRELLLRLDQALGHVEEPISPRLPLPAAMAEQRFRRSHCARGRCAGHDREGWRASWSPCWIGEARAGACSRWRCFAPTARCIASSSAPARRCAIRRASGNYSRSGLPFSATSAIPASATTRCGSRRWSPSAPIRRRRDLAATITPKISPI